jgi:hypothetical protein
MTQEAFYLGTVDPATGLIIQGSGDNAPTVGAKLNNNFDELYSLSSSVPFINAAARLIQTQGVMGKIIKRGYKL